jgi:hypothetical protein
MKPILFEQTADGDKLSDGSQTCFFSFEADLELLFPGKW